MCKFQKGTLHKLGDSHTYFTTFVLGFEVNLPDFTLLVTLLHYFSYILLTWLGLFLGQAHINKIQKKCINFQKSERSLDSIVSLTYRFVLVCKISIKYLFLV